MLRPGTNVGPYRIDAPIGAGGMGEVYRAWDTRLERAVALKVLSSETGMDAERLARFAREARAVASLDHPNVLAVHDTGAVEDQPYVVFELLEGETLKERLARGVLPARKVVEVGTQVCRGLAAAHARGIVHRDLKPANVFLTSDGGVKILDFGLARETAAAKGDLADADTPSFSAAGRVLGTPAYMSPEQVRGQPVDARSDLFALGATLYEMLTGRRAFDGATTADVMTAVLTKDPAEANTPSGAAPPALERVVRRCLEKDPEERFQSARDVGFALDAASGTAPAPATAPLPARGRGFTLAALIAVGLVVAGALGVLSRRGPAGRALPKVTQLTFRRGFVDTARWTADGQTVAYSALWDGRLPEIFTLRIDNPESRSLGLPPARLLSVSSRGELAISLVRPELGGIQGVGTLARVPLGGGTPRAILENVVAADWSPDGQELAVLRRVEGGNQIEYPIGTVLGRAAGGFIRVSPRGDRVAVGSLDELVVYDRKGTGTAVRTPRATWGLAWASDDALWLSGGDLFQARSLWLAVVGGAPREVYRGVGTLAFQDVSRDGRVLLHHGHERIAIRVKAAGEDTEREIAVSAMHHANGFSADGRRLLFSTFGSREDSTYLWSANGSEPVRLSHGNGVSLSPDARWAVTRPATPTLDALPLILTPTGPGETRTLPPGRFERATAWFLDEGRLVIDGSEARRASRVFVVGLSGGEPRPVTPEGIVSIPHSARDGYLLGRAADGTLARYPMAGGAPHPLNVRIPADRTVLRASGDGRSLFVYAEGLPRPVARLDLETGSLSPFRLLQPADLAGVAYLLRTVISADGGAYAYDYGRYLHDLYVVEGLR